MNFLKAGAWLLVMAALMGCASSPSSASRSPKENQPQWLLDINSVYPDGEYLAVVGEGDSLSKAQAKAAANMALIFESRVIVDSKVESRFVEMSNNGVFTDSSRETAVTDNISQLSDQTLLGLKYGESWTDSMGKVYASAYLNRQETARLYKSRMDDQSRALARLSALGDAETALLARYAYYDAAYVIAMGNEVMRQQLEIISPATARSAAMGYDLEGVKTSRSDAASSLSFRMEFIDEEGKTSANLAEKLTGMGFSLSPEGDLSVGGRLESEKVIRQNDYENYKWYLAIDVLDESNRLVISLEESGISASTSDSAARSRVNTDVKKIIDREFEKQFNAYLNGFLEK